MSELKWYGILPKNCDFCKNKLKKVFIDGRTKFEPWAIMCKSCFKINGVGLGIGKGQKYSIPGGQKIR